MPVEEGPYLIAALICERVLEEKDGTKSAVRIIDRVTRKAVGPSPPQIMEPFIYNVMLLIKLKSGNVRGVYQLRIELIRPSGESLPPLEFPVSFEGEEDRGTDIVGELAIPFDVPGIYWFEIYFDNGFLTRIPVRLVYLPQIIQKRVQPGDQSGPEPSGPSQS